MAEESYFWDGTIGDASLAPYDDGELMDVFFRALLNGTGDQGVLRGWANELAWTFPAANTARMDTGAAVVYGGWYENTSTVDINVPNGPRTDLIVVQRTWATQTTRLARIAGPGAAVTQTPGVVYEVPVVRVDVDGVGTVTLNADERDFCEFSTEMLPGSVGANAIQASAVTTAKILDQTRWITRGLYQLKADVTNPAIMTYGGDSGAGGNWLPWHQYWSFSDGANTDTVWCTLEVPTDITSATMEIFIWTQRAPGNVSSATAMRWAWSSWDAQPAVILLNQTNAVTVNYPDLTEAYYTGLGVGDPPVAYYPRHWRYAQRDSLGTFTATAGDIVHIEIWRDGAHGGDTFTGEGALFMVEFAYTADS